MALFSRFRRPTPIRPVPLPQHCAACGTLVDPEAAIKLARANAVYCCRCYIHQSRSGDTLARERTHSSEVLNVEPGSPAGPGSETDDETVA
jgi:hypothetical protein